MYVSPCGLYAYLATPRTGSNAIATHLMKSGWLAVGLHHDIYPDTLKGVRHIGASVREHHRTIESYFYLKGNHTVKCLNCGHEQRHPFCDFVDDFVHGQVPWRWRHYLPAPEENWLPSLFGVYLRYATDIIHLETLEHDLAAAFGPVIDDPSTIERVNESPHRIARNLWSNYAWRVVSTTFEPERKQLGYEDAEPFTPHLRRYGDYIVPA